MNEEQQEQDRLHNERLRREIFAGLALLGLVASGEVMSDADTADLAYVLADAMVARGGPL